MKIRYQPDNLIAHIPQKQSGQPVKVIKALTRKYGYCLQWIGENPPTWILGANNTWAWYRYKRDALEAAGRYNQ